MKKAVVGAIIAIAIATAQASTTKDLETSAIVNGTIVLTRDGAVQTTVIDEADKYGQPIADMVRHAALKWQFQPVLRDGEPVVAKSSMHVRVVLKQSPDGNYIARIRGATFSSDDPNDTGALREGDKKIVPKYPKAAVRARVQGTVYLALRVDRHGQVTEAVAEQVNLGSSGSDRIANKYREMLAHASIAAARTWTYAIPTTGKLANQDSWTARVPVSFRLIPVNFRLNKMGSRKIGSRTAAPVWETYVPGPFTPAPWVDKPDTSGTDALADDSIQTDGAGPILLSPIGHG